MVWVNLCGLIPALAKQQFERIYGHIRRVGGVEAAGRLCWPYVPTQRQIRLLYPQGTDVPSSEFTIMVCTGCLRWTTENHCIEIPEQDFDEIYSSVQDEYDQHQRTRAQLRMAVSGRIVESEQRSGKGPFELLVERLAGIEFITRDQAAELLQFASQLDCGVSIANLLSTFAEAARALNESGGFVVGSYTVVINPLRDGDTGGSEVHGYSGVPVDWHVLADLFGERAQVAADDELEEADDGGDVTSYWQGDPDSNN